MVQHKVERLVDLNVDMWFALQLEEKDDWEDDVDEVMHKFEAETGSRPVFTVCFY